MVEYSFYTLKKGQLTGGGPRKQRKISIFIAYSFASESSCRFRNMLEQAIKRTPTLRSIEINDGRVAVGAKWTTVIRERLKKARLVVSEFSRLSPEVLFETGFAYGLNKSILPVTNSSESLRMMPRFLTEIQFGVLSSEDSISDVVSAISECVAKSKRNGIGVSLAGRSSPNNVLLISPNSKSEVIEKVKVFCNREEMIFQHLNVDDDFDYNVDIDSVVGDVTLLIGCVDNREQDNLINFSAGMVCAHPKAGIGKIKLPKKVVFVIPNNGGAINMVADSARRITQTVKVVKEIDMMSVLSAFAETRRKWQSNQKIEHVN